MLRLRFFTFSIYEKLFHYFVSAFISLLHLASFCHPSLPTLLMKESNWWVVMELEAPRDDQFGGVGARHSYHALLRARGGGLHPAGQRGRRREASRRVRVFPKNGIPEGMTFAEDAVKSKHTSIIYRLFEKIGMKEARCKTCKEKYKVIRGNTTTLGACAKRSSKDLKIKARPKRHNPPWSKCWRRGQKSLDMTAVSMIAQDQQLLST